VFIADKYGIGTDLKFKKDGFVVIVTPTKMDKGKLT
jgi:hypothetical protein